MKLATSYKIRQNEKDFFMLLCREEPRRVKFLLCITMENVLKLCIFTTKEILNQSKRLEEYMIPIYVNMFPPVTVRLKKNDTLPKYRNIFPIPLLLESKKKSSTRGKLPRKVPFCYKTSPCREIFFLIKFLKNNVPNSD
jgi:hypothetical protein